MMNWFIAQSSDHQCIAAEFKRAQVVKVIPPHKLAPQDN